jgi:hypothetical protein
MDLANLGRAFDGLAGSSPRRGILLGGFLMGVAGALAAGRVLRALAPGRGTDEDGRVDRASADSFPASDPPAFVPGGAAGTDDGGTGRGAP